MGSLEGQLEQTYVATLRLSCRPGGTAERRVPHVQPRRVTLLIIEVNPKVEELPALNTSKMSSLRAL